ncbi:threonine ammonia-lyase [Pontibacter sp. G13]|uniref:threonine ammonia-lyase n=1 Tax=Pontibacter sp. G13 TaxID=3074898 RepID=UPI0028898E25|nr:threonine ammonia-lyase [Pontibacter sp. G13]WNJ18752.1 threonine ammonia-lyase [Pontibacter sp. G13]
MSTQTESTAHTWVSLADVLAAGERLKGVVTRTPLMFNPTLSERYQCEVFLKREDLQIVRSYKLRGAYNRISGLSQEEQEKGIVCASAGNHAQGVAYACQKLGIQGFIYMPVTTPKQKIQKVRKFGKEWVDVRLVGDTFDEAYAAACECKEETGMAFVHPFDDEAVMAGQGTVGMEILADSHSKIDCVLMPIGGGGLASGVGSYFRHLSPHTRLIGVEPAGAPAMGQSLKSGKVETLQAIDKFVDGAAVMRVGNRTFDICRQVLDDLLLVPEGKICTTILDLYNEDAIVVEPAGALTVAALDQIKDQIVGKKVVCVVSGGNNDIMRMEEIKERSMLYEGLKHYFMIRFPQRAGALREFLTQVLGESDDITHFEYTKKHNRENGPAVVGIEVQDPKDLQGLIDRMKEFKVDFKLLNDKPTLFELLV